MEKLDKLKKLLELTQNDTLKPSDVEQFLKVLIQIVKKSKDEFDSISKENQQVIKQALDYITTEHQDILSKVSQETKTAIKDFSDKIFEVEKLIAKVKTIKPIDGVDGKDGSDGKDGKDGKDGSPDTRKEIVEKINKGIKKDTKIELAQIEGTEKLESSIINRAIGIVDQRTSFLINKINNLPSSGGGISLTDLSAGTGISYDNTTGVITNSAPDQTVVLTAGTNITSITGTYPNFTINAATQAGGAGDVVGPASSVDGQVALFDGITGKLLKTDAHLYYNTTTDVLHIHALGGDATDGLLIESENGTDIAIMGAANTANVTWYGSHNFSTATQDTIAAFTGAGKTLGSLATATYPSLTELSYVKGVTSAIQTQLGTKITNNNAEVGFADLDAELIYPAWHGWIGASEDSTSAVVTSDGATVTLTVQKSGGGDLDLIFSTGIITVDCTPALTLTLTAGSDASPQLNYVYIRKAAPTVLTLSTTGFPTAEEFHPIGTFVIPSAATVQTYGTFKTHLWTDHVLKGGAMGHIAHLNEWIRKQPATWQSGVALTPTLTTASTPDTLTLATSAGSVLQLHPHDFPAFDSATAGTTNLTTFFSPNHPTPYTAGKDLCTADFLQTNGGVAVSGTQSRISWVVWGSVGEADGDAKIFVNLPSGFYTSDATAIADDSKYSVYTIPSAYVGTGFLIAKLTYRVTNSTPGSYALTLVENLDLRGTFPSIVAGGTSASSTTFADNTFQIYDEGDSTKILAFQASGITTGNTRTLTVPDTSGTLPVGTGTANEIAYWSGTNTLGTLAVATYPSLTELSYVKGVTSAIQTQINAKAPSTAPTFATSITGSYLTASEILITDGSKNIVSAAVATYPSLTELTYVKGVTSAIQTQLGTKAATATTITIAGTANQITSSAGAQDLSANRTWTLSLPADVLIPTILTVPNTGLHLLDSNASHDLIIKPGSDLTADKTLTITTGDADVGLNLTAVTDEYVLAYDTGTATWRGVAPSAGGMTWNVETTTSATMAVSNGYISNNAAAVTFTLPSTAAVGSTVRVVGLGAGGWVIAQNASEYIYFGNQTTTTGTGGSLASTHSKDAVELLCVVADTGWVVLSSQGNITVV
jgi:gas vesicle protein